MAKGEERRVVKEHKRSMGKVPIQDAEKEFIAGFRFKMYLLRSTAESIFCGPNKEREMLGDRVKVGSFFNRIVSQRKVKFECPRFGLFKKLSCQR